MSRSVDTARSQDLRCPLCHGARVRRIDTLRVADIVALYRRTLQVDVAAEFGAVTEVGLCRCEDCDLRFFTPTVAGGERMYESLQRFPWYYLSEKAEYTYAQQHTRPQDLVLEIGCGSGAFGRSLKVQEYVGLEFSAEATRMAQSQGLQVVQESVQEHARHHAARYDVVCAFQVLEHVSECGNFVQASLDCLKPGGLLIYSIPSADSFMAMAKNNALNMPPHHITWWSDRCLTRLAGLFNLELVGLDHEALSDLHRRNYLNIVLLQSLLGNKAGGDSIMNVSLSFRVVSKLAALGARLLERGLADPRVRPRGHSVTAVYRKGS